MNVIFEGQVWRKKNWVEGIGSDLEPHIFDSKEFVKYEKIYEMDVEESLIKKDQKFFFSDLGITVCIVDAVPTIKKGEILDYHCYTNYEIRIEERTEENKKRVEKDTIFYEDLYQKNLKSRQSLESWKQETNKKGKSKSLLSKIFS
jgi:hypothetical protein